MFHITQRGRYVSEDRKGCSFVPLDDGYVYVVDMDLEKFFDCSIC